MSFESEYVFMRKNRSGATFILHLISQGHICVLYFPTGTTHFLSQKGYYLAGIPFQGNFMKIRWNFVYKSFLSIAIKKYIAIVNITC